MPTELPTRLFVVGRNEIGALPGLKDPPAAVFTVLLNSRERGALPALAVPVTREQYQDLTTGTEVELTLRAVRS